RTENILHRNFTRRQVAIQNRVASNIGISQSTFSVDRKSGSAGMPRPRSYAVFCLKKKSKSEDALRPDVALVHGGLPSVLSREPQDLARNCRQSAVCHRFRLFDRPAPEPVPTVALGTAGRERSKAQSSSRSCEPGGAGGRKSAVLSGSLAAVFRFSRRQAMRKRFPRRRAYGPVPRMRCPKRGSYSRPPRMAQISDITCAARPG